MSTSSNLRIVALVLTVGCASGTHGPQMVRQSGERGDSFSVRVRRDAHVVERFLYRTLDQTWAALPAAFADVGYKGAASSVSSEHVYMTPELIISGRLYTGEPNSDYLDCGRTSAGGAAADVYSVKFVVLVKAASVDSGTVLSLLVDGVARDRTQGSNVVTCTGTGRLEDMFFKAIAQRAGS